mmetsp:Transcript_147632/g.283010  ORF Transcript_147632/g.283010 Transcript_147632/m.283010 type:complete len:115 (-) Transcript_147632:19-363(-)
MTVQALCQKLRGQRSSNVRITGRKPWCSHLLGQPPFRCANVFEEGVSHRTFKTCFPMTWTSAIPEGAPQGSSYLLIRSQALQAFKEAASDQAPPAGLAELYRRAQLLAGHSDVF